MMSENEEESDYSDEDSEYDYSSISSNEMEDEEQDEYLSLSADDDGEDFTLLVDNDEEQTPLKKDNYFPDNEESITLTEDVEDEKVKILCIGDPHFQVKNSVDVRDFTDKLLLELKKPENAVDFIVVLGDILHTHETIHVTPLKLAEEFLDKLREIAPTFLIIGNHDLCFSKNTPILMWDGTQKLVQNIEIGDILYGDDDTQRTVLTLNKGMNLMYNIHQHDENLNDYVVTANHQLCLIYSDTEECSEVAVSDYLKLSSKIKSNLLGISNNNGYVKTTKISVSPSKETEYYGFSTDENNRFLLADRTVVHNCNASQFLTTNHAFNGLKEWENLEIVDKVKSYTIKDFTFFLCPYVPPGRFEEALNTSDDLWETADCIFAHQEFKGCKMGSIISENGDKWDEDYPPVISGHIHDEQFVEPNIYYVGSAMQHSFGDTTPKAVWITTFTSEGEDNESGFTYKKLKIGVKEKKTIKMNVDNIEEFKLDLYKNCHLKIVLRGTSADFSTFRKSKKYKLLVKQKISFGFDPIVVNATDIKKELEEGNGWSPCFSTILGNLLEKESDQVRSTFDELF